MKTPTIIFTFCALLVVGCERTPNSGAKTSQFADPPISMTVKQRSTTAVPGTGDALRLTIGDITRGQVIVSLSAKDGFAVLAPVSLRAHGTARFKYRNGDYVLRLTKLDDALIGEDFASFFIAGSASDAVPEDAKIERRPNPGAKVSQFAEPPISMTVKQRSTTAVLGAGDALRLTIDNITGGQAMVSLSAKDGSAVLAPVALRAHGTARFKYGNGDYVLRLTKLHDALIGKDFASFFIADSASDAVPEDTKIEQLLALIEEMDDAIFIRNGTEFSPKDAALHLQNKWLRNETESARKFIKDHASRSSESGEPYQILFPNGTTVPLGDYLRERLGEIEFP